MLVTPLRKFGWRNIEDLRAGVDEKLGKKCTLTEFFGDLWLATKSDAVYGATSAAAVGTDPRATSKRRGREFDFINEYKQNRHITYSFGFAHIFTGSFLNQATTGKDYNYLYAYLTYIFK